MRIDFDRICKLAGVSSRSSRGGLISEGAYHSEGEADPADEMKYEGESDSADEMKYEGEADPTDEMHFEGESDPEDQDEMVEVDMGELMSEIRRAKKIIAVNEQKKTNIAMRKRRLQENHLKRVIQKEVENVLSEIEDRDSSWVYGNRKPRHSREGYTNHGRTLPGIGFNKKW